jgi:CTP:molybdopterin cytidylyltransferase MocA
VVVLAAGEGTRMRSSIPKVLHTVGGRTLVHHAVAAAAALEPDHLVVVVGHGRDQVKAHLTEVAPTATTAVQDEQLGTGHAVACALSGLPRLDGTVVVTYGDVPLLTTETDAPGAALSATMRRLPSRMHHWAWSSCTSIGIGSARMRSSSARLSYNLTIRKRYSSPLTSIAGKQNGILL